MAPPTQSRLTYDDVENDYNNAINKVSYYSDRMHSLASVKSDTFSTALNYFSSFLGLKDGQDLITKYSGVVILAAGMILPELGLAAALVKSEAKLAQLEELLKMAEKLEKVTERAKSVVEKIGSFREHRELKKGLQEDSDLSEQRE